jgi:hypothetical protein
MNEQPQPATPISDIDPGRQPRFVSREQMQTHHDNRAVTALSPGDRHRMFVRYDHTWWIGDPTGFHEITNPGQNAKLDRWHERLTNGALWT